MSKLFSPHRIKLIKNSFRASLNGYSTDEIADVLIQQLDTETLHNLARKFLLSEPKQFSPLRLNNLIFENMVVTE